MRELAEIDDRALLSILFYEHGLESYDNYESQRERSHALVYAVVQTFDDRRAEETIISLLEYLFRERGNFLSDDRQIIAALRLDGFQRDGERLIATTPAPAALAPELSALETRLAELGWAAGSAHYGQAHQSYVDERWEAANGQMRSFLESLFIELGNAIAGSTRDNAPAALQDLRNAGRLDETEYNMVRSFWNDIQDNGPHQGLSGEQEALFRLHVGTALARYLLHKLIPAS